MYSSAAPCFSAHHMQLSYLATHWLAAHIHAVSAHVFLHNAPSTFDSPWKGGLVNPVHSICFPLCSFTMVQRLLSHRGLEELVHPLPRPHKGTINVSVRWAVDEVLGRCGENTAYISSRSGCLESLERAGGCEIISQARTRSLKHTRRRLQRSDWSVFVQITRSI